MRKFICILCSAAFAFAAAAQTPELKPEVFELLNLEYKGLEKVKAAYETGDTTIAAAELLNYFKARKEN